MNLLELLDRPIAFHRSFVTITKSVTGALFLSQALYWSNRTSDSEGWFYKSREDWLEETGMGRWEQETARKILRNIGVLEEKLKGVPATIHYRVNKEKLIELIRAAPSSWRENHQLDGGKGTNWLDGIHPTISETTTETTSKKRIGSVNGSKPSQDTVETFCQSIGLPRSDGEIMILKWNADGWPKNWMDKIRYWKRCGFMPSQKSGAEPPPKPKLGQPRYPDFIANYPDESTRRDFPTWESTQNEEWVRNEFYRWKQSNKYDLQ